MLIQYDSFKRIKISYVYLSEWFDFRGHLVLVFTELAAFFVGAFDPLLQTLLVYKLHAAITEAGRDEGRVVLNLTHLTLTDPTAILARGQHGQTGLTSLRQLGGGGVHMEGLLQSTHSN